MKTGLYKARRLSTNVLIGLQEVRKGYGIIFVLMLIVTMLVMVPVRSLQAMQAQDFVTYMGSPICDLLAEVTQGDSLEERNKELSNLLREEAEKSANKKSRGNLQRNEKNEEAEKGTRKRPPLKRRPKSCM